MFLGKKPELWAPLEVKMGEQVGVTGAQPGQQVKCDLKTLVQGSQDGDATEGATREPHRAHCPESAARWRDRVTASKVPPQEKKWGRSGQRQMAGSGQSLQDEHREDSRRREQGVSV